MTYITEFKILERNRVKHSEGTLNIVRTYGRIKFDGRLRKDQVATFIAFTGRDDYEDKVSFKVVVEKKSGTVRREMKACAQKDAIDKELLGYVHRENLREAIREDEKENESENDSDREYGVDRERQLAAAHSRSDAIISNAMVASAAVKDSNDKLEIPSFLKRS